jgi:hypothetical protein
VAHGVEWLTESFISIITDCISTGFTVMVGRTASVDFAQQVVLKLHYELLQTPLDVAL